MEENDGEYDDSADDSADATELAKNCRGPTPQPGTYRSTQSDVNGGSQQTLYHSVRSTLYGDDAVNLEFVNDSRTAAGDRPPMDGSSTLEGTAETVVEGSCGDLRQSIDGGNSRLLNDFKESSSLYFRDGVRSIDFVLVWDERDERAVSCACNEFRKVFERNLETEGLELEYEAPEASGLRFIKIHAPRQVLRRYAEILKLRLAMKSLQGFASSPSKTIIRQDNSFFRRFMRRFNVDPTIFPTMKHRFTAVYSRDKEYLFDIDSPEFFTSATHSRIVEFILDRTRFSENGVDDFAFGVERLTNERAYVASYPLHDGNVATPGSMRHLLYTEWASVGKWLHHQPLDYVKEYFGVKIGLYFAWLGFYTHMLIFASVAGLLCFAFGCLTLYSNKPSEDICTSDESIDMCPVCDEYCRFWDLRKTCLHARITYLFDNPATVVFSVFMSLWATLFLELWKNYSAEITHRWDLTGFDAQEEHPRPQYLARLAHVGKKTVNAVTNTVEPRVPFWSVRLPATILSFSVVVSLIAVAMAAVIGVILYRMSVVTTVNFLGESRMITSNAILFTTATAACINLCCIVLLNWLYVWLAEYLTEIELLRTQSEFDDSLTLKIYLLQFVNYYASIFYIAFLKGKFVGYPSAYKRFFAHRQEECGPGGCLTELCIQLSIIMIGKQAINTLLEMLLPLFYKWLNSLKVGARPRHGRELDSRRTTLRWVRDFKLVRWGPRSLFPEYLEMVLQYGFVTIFVSAFPLAPFFALLNNVFETRLDAKKLLTMYRRPVGQRVRDIGVWYRILDSISKISVITNGFIIAFTSNFIPKLVYRYTVSDNYSLDGFLRYSLSAFKTRDLENYKNNGTDDRIDVCLFPDYREPPDSPRKYDRSLVFWHILAARLAFVVVFENAVAMVMILVRWCIPDTSPELRDKIRRETYITNEIIIHHEARRRACARASVEINEPQFIRRRPNGRESAERWNRVVTDSSVSMSDFDLQVDGRNPLPTDGISPRVGPAAL